MKGWEQQTKILQEDILRSKSIADDLERDFNASGKALDDTEFMVDFCNREFHYSSQLSQILKQAQHSNSFLRDAGVACEEKRVTDSLSILDRMFPRSTLRPIVLNIHRFLGFAEKYRG